MNLYIPLAHGQSIPSEVFKNLANQTIAPNLIPCCTDGMVNSNRNTSIEKLTGEMASRNLALDRMLKDGHEFALMQDRDVVHFGYDNYERAVDYMRKAPGVGILSLPWKDYEVTEHINMMAMVIRIEAVKCFRFRFDERNHACLCMMDDIKCKFMPSDRKLVKELVLNGIL